MTDETTVSTTLGPVRGAALAERGVVVWKGIPYAAPPVGDLRFAPPQAATAWDHLRDCSSFGSASIQPKGALRLPRPVEVVDNEDCLTLNIWAPADRSTTRAVFVWIHGGANMTGSSADHVYDGTNLAAGHDIIVVSINYRLGALGRLALADTGHVGNNDLLDTIAALGWTRDNITHFGGDPDRITVGGESAGACMVCALLVSPHATGLFHQAIIASGHGSANADIDLAHIARDIHLDALGIPLDGNTIQFLRALPIDDLLDAQAAAVAKLGTPYKAVEDGDILPPVLDAFAEGRQQQVPILVGTCRDEHNLFTVLGAGHNVVPADTPLRKRFEQILIDPDPTLLDRLEELYLSLGGDDTAAWNIACTDRDWRAPQRVLALHHADSGAPVYHYDWAFPSTAANGAIGAGHAIDLAFCFDNLDQPGIDQLVGNDQENPHRRLVAAQTSQAWASFIRDGQPTSDHLPDWPRYDRTSQQTMVIGVEPHAGPDIHRERLDLWDDIPAIPPLHTPYTPEQRP